MRALKLILFVASLINICTRSINAQYEVPDARIEPLHPSGLRVSIPDSPGIQQFTFDGSINMELNGTVRGTYSRSIHHPTDGRWVFDEHMLSLKPGDKLYYRIFVHVNGLGYGRDNQVYTVSSFNYPPAAVTTAAPPLATIPTQPSRCLTASADRDRLRNNFKMLTTVFKDILKEQQPNDTVEDRRFVLKSTAPATGNEVQDVQNFFNETLGVNADVEDAWTSANVGGVVVILKNRVDKLMVMLSACLHSANELISDPQGSIPRDAVVPNINMRLLSN